MKKTALVFVLAVLAPSLVLAWLAVRSLRDQQLALERQQALLYQGVADTIAKDVAGYIAAQQREFTEHVRTLHQGKSPVEVANHFDGLIRSAWPMAQVGFAVTLDGKVYSPELFGRDEARQFRLENDRFLCSREAAEVYFNAGKAMIPLSKTNIAGSSKTSDSRSDLQEAGLSDTPQTSAVGIAIERKLAMLKESGAAKFESGEAEFRQLVSGESDGVVARYLQNRLAVLVWHRTDLEREVVYGAQLDLARVTAGLREFARPPAPMDGDIVVQLLDDMERPVTEGRLEGERTPFVTAGIGPMLPHWKVAVFLADPHQLPRAAGTLKWTLSLIVVVMIGAILAGGGLIVLDLRRQLLLARQKTDFVSNVSHELKTPLTSIRMFSELLGEGKVQNETQQKQFLSIINSETARLTRLINNVLDFARMERGEKRYDFARCDLREIVRNTVDSYRPQLEASGLGVHLALPDTEVVTNGDGDALAQVLVNLLSNAEKYAGAGKEVRIELGLQGKPGEFPCQAELRVLDRGPGVPRGCEEKIFEQFYRAHDSLSSGVQGSGLGLTLARQIARAHGGDLRCEERKEGGSAFVLTLPCLRVSGHPG